MPAEAISLALAASIYPPALAAVIALARGADVKLRVVLFVAAAYATVLVTGALMLLLFTELGASQHDVSAPPAAVYVLAGLALLALALSLHRRPHTRPREASERSATPSRTERYLGSRRLVMVLALVLYVVPSPIYIAAVKAIADTHEALGVQVAYLALMLLLMLWIIEVPMILLLVMPKRSLAALEGINSWFAANARTLGELAAAVVGLYLLAVGLVALT